MDSKEKILSEIDLRTFIETETGRKFDKNNKICCPLHNEKTASFTVKHYADKDRYHCFGCGRRGDIIDFVKEYKNMNYDNACDYIGIAPNEEHKKIMTLMDKVKKSIDNCHFKDNQGNPLKYLRTHIYVDASNNILYFEPRFKDTSNNKTVSRFFSITENNCIVPKRGCDAVPYNQYKLLEGLRNHKNIFIVEGAKDADTLIYFGYLATSFKGVKDFDYGLFRDAIVYIIPDTGETGEKYKDDLYYKLKDYVKEFNVIYPQGLKELGNNKDITDWFQSGKTITDFKAALNDKWDYKLSRFWRDVKVKVNSKGDKTIIPKVTSWRNIEQVLKFENIHLKYNLISHEAESSGNLSSTGDELIIDIQTKCSIHKLEVSKDIVCDAILKISRKNKYNPFIDYLKINKNDNYKLIENIFNCIDINNEFISKRETYLKYFTRWLMDLVTMAQNTIEKGLKSQGVLTLQGKQGCKKSTFFKKLMNNNEWFKGEAEIDPKDKDSVIKNTKYILSELAELDGMTRKGQDSMKRFLTNDIDNYRVPYGRCVEKHPRTTTFCATVNPRDFLKDKTGSRRFWVIPVERCNIEAMEQIDINEFWGAVYGLWLTGTVPNYLDESDIETLIQDNTEFNITTNISIAIDEKFDFNQNEIAWKTYNLGEIAKIIEIKETKAIKTELERRCFRYGSQRDNYLGMGKTKTGFKLPNVDIIEADRLERDFNNNPFEEKSKLQEQQEDKPKEPIKLNPWEQLQQDIRKG